jgi:Fe-S-cluster containining protein
MTVDPLCAGCGGWCCRVLRVETPTPDHVRWIEGRAIAMAADETGAYALVESKCRYLTDGGLCGIQERKPLFCQRPQPGGEMCRQVLRKFKPELLAKIPLDLSATGKQP